MSSTAVTDFWSRIDHMIDAAPTTADLFEHRLHLLAGRRFRELGKPVPAEIEFTERVARLVDLSVEPLLGQICAAYHGRMILLKGPELAARYPDPSLRPFGDLDLLVDDAPGVHAVLRQAGFQEVGDPRMFVDIHHLRPLQWPTLPLAIEIHAEPKWLDGAAAPSTEELFAAAVPARVGGIETLSIAHHAVTVAVHSWAHEPLRDLRELIDVALLAAEADHEEVGLLARSWGVERVWNATARAIDALFYGGSRPLPLRSWARNVVHVRGRTVFESHLEKALVPFSTMPPAAAIRMSSARVLAEMRPNYGEPWRRKLARAGLAFRNAGTRRSIHHDEMRRRGMPLSPLDVPHGQVRPRTRRVEAKRAETTSRDDSQSTN